jgi:hypothetical protein
MSITQIGRDRLFSPVVMAMAAAAAAAVGHALLFHLINKIQTRHESPHRMMMMRHN